MDFSLSLIPDVKKEVLMDGILEGSIYSSKYLQFIAFYIAKGTPM
jgi:hypothetical protein